MSRLDSIKSIVRIMDFHALARIDKAKKASEKTKTTEQLIEQTIRQIYYNKNLNIDKRLLLSNPLGVDLNIYIGSDLSFCGDFNTSILAELAKDTKGKVVIVGQKILHASNRKYIYAVSKDKFHENYYEISRIIDKYLSKKRMRSVNIIYNRYYSIDDIRLEKSKIFPIVLEKSPTERYDVDFVIEDNPKRILTNLTATYLNYKIIIAEKSSWAAENVNRERLARESLKRIDELKEKERQRLAQEETEKRLVAQIDNFEKIKWRKS